MHESNVKGLQMNGLQFIIFSYFIVFIVIIII